MYLSTSAMPSTSNQNSNRLSEDSQPRPERVSVITMSTHPQRLPDSQSEALDLRESVTRINTSRTAVGETPMDLSNVAHRSMPMDLSSIQPMDLSATLQSGPSNTEPMDLSADSLIDKSPKLSDIDTSVGSFTATSLHDKPMDLSSHSDSNSMSLPPQEIIPGESHAIAPHDAAGPSTGLSLESG